MHTSRTRFAVATVMAGFLFAPLSPAHADDDHDDFRDQRDERPAYYVTRDTQGRRTGTLEEAPGGTLIQRDTSGRRVGTIERREGGDMVVRDNAGRRVGTIERY